MKENILYAYHINVENIKEYKYNEFTNALYIKGKPVKIKDNEFKIISTEIKKYYINSIYQIQLII